MRVKKILKYFRNNKKKVIIPGLAGAVILAAMLWGVWPFFRPIRVIGKFIPYEYTVYGTYVEINRYTGDEEVVEIPGWIWFRPVKVLGSQPYKVHGEVGAFYENESVRKVSMPDSIEEMAIQSFEWCVNLEEVHLSNSLKWISWSAFYGCESLKSMEIPEGVEGIGGNAFTLCKSLESVRFPESLKRILGAAFQGCEKLEFVEIPEGVEVIDGDSFGGTGWEKGFQEDFVVVGKNVLIYYGGNEREVKVPEGVEYIGSYVFQFNEEMESLELPLSLKKCDWLMVFCGCENLRYVTVRNPSMEFGEDMSMEVFYVDSPELTLIGEKGSTAEAYAEAWGHEFVELQPED